MEFEIQTVLFVQFSSHSHGVVYDSIVYDPVV